jgi:hypothetical protein
MEGNLIPLSEDDNLSSDHIKVVIDGDNVRIEGTEESLCRFNGLVTRAILDGKTNREGLTISVWPNADPLISLKDKKKKPIEQAENNAENA